MRNPAEQFADVHQVQLDWSNDRPFIFRNNSAEISVPLSLLYEEISELNGGDHSGPFESSKIERDPVLRDDYRQQEIADILIYVMTSQDKLDQPADYDRIYERTVNLCQEMGFEFIDENEQSVPLKGISKEENKHYLDLRSRLNNTADLLYEFDYEVDGGLLPGLLEDAFVYSSAMLSLLGVSPVRAIREKIARNMIKYPAQMFVLPEGNYSEQELEEMYQSRRAEANDLFEGEVDAQTGERAKKGTQEFYGKEETVVYEYETENPQAVGILYRAAAQLISGVYGWRNRRREAKRQQWTKTITVS